ncbi:MAG: 2-oxoisovalerate dehydrogenase [Planctomycetes bacterium]|nr:2-oxoisovalerate dehydrogenase [Planctomycetota bacterium]
MNELIFLISDAPESGYSARALGESIFTEGETLDELRKSIRAAVACHFDKDQAPKILRLHFVREEVLAL